jgi:hypothetical protein
MTSIQLLDNREETTMLKADDKDDPLEDSMEIQETYPKEVLESEWNPVIAQLQLLKREEWLQQQNEMSHRLSVPEMDLPDYKQ